MYQRRPLISRLEPLERMDWKSIFKATILLPKTSIKCDHPRCWFLIKERIVYICNEDQAYVTPLKDGTLRFIHIEKAGQTKIDGSRLNYSGVSLKNSSIKVPLGRREAHRIYHTLKQHELRWRSRGKWKKVSAARIREQWSQQRIHRGNLWDIMSLKDSGAPAWAESKIWIQKTSAHPKRHSLPRPLP